MHRHGEGLIGGSARAAVHRSARLRNGTNPVADRVNDCEERHLHGETHVRFLGRRQLALRASLDPREERVFEGSADVSIRRRLGRLYLLRYAPDQLTQLKSIRYVTHHRCHGDR